MTNYGPAPYIYTNVGTAETNISVDLFQPVAKLGTFCGNGNCPVSWRDGVLKGDPTRKQWLPSEAPTTPPSSSQFFFSYRQCTVQVLCVFVVFLQF